MPQTRVDIEVDVSEPMHEIDRLLAEFAPEVFLRLEKLLAAAFLSCWNVVHVETGSLKSTGRPESLATATEWGGRVHFGGAAPGFPRDPAFYGVFELARGGLHFFLQPAYEIMGPERVISNILQSFER